MVPVVEKAILNADLGLNPVTAGSIIRVPLPQLTEQRRKELIRVIREEGEGSKVAVRNVRRDANNSIKESLKAKTISEDDERRAEAEIQKVTDKIIADIDKVISIKEADLLEI
jgi:ribosome recycling factor